LPDTDPYLRAADPNPYLFLPNAKLNVPFIPRKLITLSKIFEILFKILTPMTLTRKIKQFRMLPL
jgi:hypothetical protein